LQILNHPDLLLAQAWVQRIRGQVDAMALTLDRAEAIVEREAPAIDPATVEIWRAEFGLLQRMFLPGIGTSVQDILEVAMRAIASIPWETHAAGSSALILANAGRQMVGQQEDAVRLLTDALAECGDRSDPFALHRAQCASLGLMAVWLAAGDLARFHLVAEDLLALATAHDLGWGASAAQTYLGLHAYEQDHLESAIAHFSAAVDEPEASSLILVHAFLGLAFAQEKGGCRSDADATVNRYLDRLIATNATAEIPTVRAFQASWRSRGVIWLRPSVGCARALCPLLVGPRTSSRSRS